MRELLLRFFRWLAAIFSGGRVPYEPLVVRFPPVDILRYRTQLDLDREGSQNGSRNLPAPDNLTFDAVEQRIVTSIESERSKAHEIYIINMRAYGERLRALRIHALLQRAAVAAEEARTDFSDASNSGKDRLFELERTLTERSRELEKFRAENRLDRPSNRPESRILHFGIVAVLLVVESVLNGLFFARGLAFGYVQGIGEAAIIAGLNVGSGLVLGAFFLRRLHHRRALWALLGCIGTFAYGCFAIALNLGVAHYRDALGGPDPENAATLAWRSLQAQPFHVADINSLLLLVMGMSFSVIAMVDGYKMDDPYPGYGRLVASYRQEQGDLLEAKEEETARLAEIKDRILDRLDRHTSEIEARRSAYHAVLQQRDGYRQLFLRHLEHLEQAGNELLTCYRSANTRARTEPAPLHFSQRWIMPRPDVGVLENEDQGSAPFPDAEAERVLGQLAETRRDILTSYAEAQAQYSSIAEVIQGTRSHASPGSSEVVSSS
jgi:hypothetical protein